MFRRFVIIVIIIPVVRVIVVVVVASNKSVKKLVQCLNILQRQEFFEPFTLIILLHNRVNIKRILLIHNRFCLILLLEDLLILILIYSGSDTILGSVGGCVASTSTTTTSSSSSSPRICTWFRWSMMIMRMVLMRSRGQGMDEFSFRDVSILIFIDRLK